MIKYILCCCFWLHAQNIHAAPLQRILALTPHVCEMLYAIGASANIVGAVDYCNYPEAAKALPRVGNYQGINVEAAWRLKPDVAVVLSRSTKGVAALEALGVDIVVSNPSSFDGIFQSLLLLGTLTNHSQEAIELVSQQRLRLIAVQRKARTNLRVFYEVWHAPLIAAGGTSFINALIDDAGAINIFSQITLEAPRVNVEAVIRGKPDVIIIPGETHDLQARQLFWEKWLGKKHIHFVTVPADLMHRPGPRLIEGLEILQHLLKK
ncbi:MAG: cobalamin-binding protein [Mariprofundaceae bacterium]|nr:cobalamin-binding protein [Mariprofundaceae bacterium]